MTQPPQGPQDPSGPPQQPQQPWTPQGDNQAAAPQQPAGPPQQPQQQWTPQGDNQAAAPQQPNQSQQPSQPGAYSQPDQAAGAPGTGQPQNPSGNYGQAGFPPPGQPGQPQAGGPGQPGQPGVPPYPTQPPKSGPGRKILFGVIGCVVVLALIIGGIALFGGILGGNSWPKAGECVELTGSTSNADIKKVSCSPQSGKVIYTVAKVGDGSPMCANDNYTKYYERTKSGSTRKYACLMPNLIVGNCYKDNPNQPIEEVACTDTAAEVKVSKQIDNGNGTCDTASGEVSAKFPDPSPGRTYCFASPE